jgi:hypothetical protein
VLGVLRRFSSASRKRFTSARRSISFSGSCSVAACLHSSSQRSFSWSVMRHQLRRKDTNRLGYTIDVKETTVGYRTQYIALLRLPVVSPNAVLVTTTLDARVPRLAPCGRREDVLRCSSAPCEPCVGSCSTTPGLLAGTLKGPVNLTGGAFGPEASIFAVAVCLAVAVLLLWRTVQLHRVKAPLWSKPRGR